MQIETLEGRQLFAVTAPTLASGELQVFGDQNANIIKVLQADASTIRVEVDGQVFQFVDSAVTSIRLNVSPSNASTGTDGDDKIEVVSTSALPLTETVRAFGGKGNDTIKGGDGFNFLFGEDGNDTLTGGKAADTLNGGSGNNTLDGKDGDDLLTAGSGNDTFEGGGGTDKVDYSDRTKNLRITLDNVANDGELTQLLNGVVISLERDNVKDSVEDVVGGSGNDVIIASNLNINNVFVGGAGNDRLEGKAGQDRLFGGIGNDTMLGGDDNDGMLGGDGNDVMSGGKGNDNVEGEAGNDIITGGLGRDFLRGGAGDDMIFAQDGQIDGTIDGGAGNDLLEADDNDPAATLVEQLL